MKFWFTQKKVVQSATRKHWYGPFDTRAEAVRYANANGWPKVK